MAPSVKGTHQDEVIIEPQNPACHLRRVPYRGLPDEHRRGLFPQRLKGRQRLDHVPWLFLVPAGAMLTAFFAWPMIVSVYLSLTRLNIFYLANWLRAPFVALANYAQIFHAGNPVASQFWRSLENALVFTASTIIIGLPLGVVAAHGVSRPIRGRGAVRVLYIVPYAVPGFVSGLVWRLMFLSRVGLVDRLLGLVDPRLRSTYWLIGPHALLALIATNVWSSWPFFYMFCLAALQTVQPELYEAGRLDGANGIATFREITWPLIRGSMAIALVLAFVYHFNNFTAPYVLFGGSPPPSATTLPLNIYQFGFADQQFGFATAMSTLSAVVLIVPVIVYLRRARVTGSAY